MTKERAPMLILGKCDCPSCGMEVPFKQQSNGHAAVSCQWCGFQSYARNAESDANMRKKWLKGGTAKETPPASAPSNTTQPPSSTPAKPKTLLGALK